MNAHTHTVILVLLSRYRDALQNHELHTCNRVCDIIIASSFKLECLCRTFSEVATKTERDVQAAWRLLMQIKRNLYIALVRSHLSYCSQLWRPLLFKNIAKLEQIQRRATKYILCDYSESYKQRLTTLSMLPLMHRLELMDLLFLVKNLKQPQDNFNILDHVRFITSSSRLGSNHKLAHNYTRCNKARHFYFNRVVRLWNEMPRINLNMSYREIKNLLFKFFWEDFKKL